MNVLDLAHELNLSPRRSVSTNGGEYKSKCPKCQEGRDRFCIWPSQGTSGRYWCRVCETKGDAIQFCRDFLGMTFQQACQKVNIFPRQIEIRYRKKPNVFLPHVALSTTHSWQQAARNFITNTHTRLMHESQVVEQLVRRGLTLETIQQFGLGWNAENLFDRRERWGLTPEINETGFLRRQWLPKGIVIPFLYKDDPQKIKIRRTDWSEEDRLPKYVEISGSRQSPSVYGDLAKPVIIVESELDAILIQQEASDLVCSIALGGVSKKPDAELHARLKQAALILLSLDFDDVGKKHYLFWIKLYPNLRPWPAPFFKSPGDAIMMPSMDMRKWVRAGLSLDSRHAL